MGLGKEVLYIGRVINSKSYLIRYRSDIVVQEMVGR